MTTPLLAALLGVVLLTAPLHADTIYSYVGNPFPVVSGIYEAGDHLVGSLTIPDGFAYDPNSSLSPIPIYSFTDGHQTLTQENSSGLFNRNFDQTVLPRVPVGSTDWWWVSISGLEGSITTTYGSGLDLIDRASLGTSSGVGTTGWPDMRYAMNSGTWTVQTISTPELVIFPKLLPRLLGWGVEAKVVHALQRATTWLAAAILRAPHSATEIYLPALTVKVIEECAGYQTLGLMLLVAGLIAAVQKRFAWRASLSCMVIVVAALLALEANALRVVLIALGGEHRDGIQYATTSLALVQLVVLARRVRP